MKWPGSFGDHRRPDAERRLAFIRRFWEEAFDRLESYLRELKRKENSDDSGKQKPNGHNPL